MSETMITATQHAAALEAKDAEWQAKLDHWGERYRQGIETQQKEHDEATAKREAQVADLSQQIDLLKQTHAAELAAVEEKADFQVNQYALAHREALAILSESPDARALRAQQAREAAELSARQEADRKALSAKLLQ